MTILDTSDKMGRIKTGRINVITGVSSPIVIFPVLNNFSLTRITFTAVYRILKITNKTPQ